MTAFDGNQALLERYIDAERACTLARIEAEKAVAIARIEAHRDITVAQIAAQQQCFNGWHHDHTQITQTALAHNVAPTPPAYGYSPTLLPNPVQASPFGSYIPPLMPYSAPYQPQTPINYDIPPGLFGPRWQ